MKVENLRRSKFLNAQSGEPLTHVDRSSKVLALHDTGQQTASKGIASAVGIIDLLLGDGVDREFLNGVLALDGNEGRLGALCDNGNSLSLAVLLGQVGEVLANVLGLLGRQVVRFGVGSGLGLIANDVVPVRGGGVDGVLEELGDEGSRERQNKDLVILGSLLRELHNGGRADYIIHIAC